MIKLSLNSEKSLNDAPCSNHVNGSGCDQGFTFIELCIVIAIIATLSAIAIPNYLGYKYKAKIMVAITDIRMIEEQISLFVQENNGQLPNSLSNLTTIGALKDPWGNPYKYLDTNGGTAPGKRKNMSENPVNNDYDLYSMGKDGKSQQQFSAARSRDDIVRAYEGRYVGLVSEL